MSDVPKDFDPIAIVVDWLDACRKRDLAALLDLYAADASLECACDGISIQGHSALEAYWHSVAWPAPMERPAMARCSRRAMGR